MAGQLKPDKIRQYASRFAYSIAEQLFQDNREKVTGPELKTLTAVAQVNLFTVRELLIRWEAESEKLKSSWFDYSAPAVQEALGQFRNVLSNHIAVGKQDLLQLLEKAVADTLLVALSPYDYYADLLDTREQRKIRVSDLRTQVRYMRINQLPMEQFLEAADHQRLTEITGKESFALLDQVLERTGFEPEDAEPVLATFSKVLPVTRDDFFESRKAEPKAEPRTEPTPKVEQKPEPRPEPKPKPVVEVTPKPEEPPTVAAKKPENTVRKPAPAQGAVQTSLYDELGAEARPTLADNFQKQKIQRLREHMNINQKFMFTKMLFNGDFELFDEALERLDRMDNIRQADRYLEDSYPEWDKESEEYLEFRELVERRFL